MRGGPRMTCSPYLTGSLALMLLLVTFNYWSVSTNNFDLVKEVKNMQTQLKTGSGTIQERERETKSLKEDLRKCDGGVENLREEVKRLESVKEELKMCNNDKDRLNKDKVDQQEQAGREARKAQEVLSQEVAKEKEENESLSRRLDELQEELDKEKERVKKAKAELVSLKAEQLVSAGHVQAPPQHLAREGGLGEGQLADVDPGAVSVVRKETQGGGSLHLGPVLPQGPSSPKPPMGISSSSNIPVIVDNVAGVMPPPLKLERAEDTNLDQAEDDAHIAHNENGPEGKNDLQDDDQNPDGEIDERVDPGKGMDDDTKDENDEGLEDVEDNVVEDDLAEEEDPVESLKVESPNT